MLLSVKGAGDPCSAYQPDKELGMALKGGRKSWEMSLGWAFPAPCSGKHCKKLDSLGKCSYKWLLFFSCHITMKEKDPPKYFFSIKGRLSTTKKDNSKEYFRQLPLISSRDWLVEELN